MLSLNRLLITPQYIIWLLSGPLTFMHLTLFQHNSQLGLTSSLEKVTLRWSFRVFQGCKDNYF